MPVRIGTGLSTLPEPRAAAMEAGSLARAALDGEPCDLAIVFASGAYLAAPEAMVEAVQETLAPGGLIGCGGHGGVGPGGGIEGATPGSGGGGAVGGGEAAAVPPP